MRSLGLMFESSAAWVLLAVVSPLLGLLVLLLFLESSRPIFRQIRVGRSEIPFVVFKLRTMRLDVADLPTHAVSVYKITPLGRFIRKAKLDELPQLINIGRGEMSFVGYRPCLPTQSVLVEARRDLGLFEYNPGLTGIGQVLGVDMSTPETLARIDALYYRSGSKSLYFRVLAATVMPHRFKNLFLKSFAKK